MNDSMATRDAFGQILLKIGAENPKVVVLSGDLAESTRALPFGEKYPDRFFEMGISEQDLFGTAAGFALGGKIPFACTYAVFAVSRAFDQIRVAICYTGANVKIAVTHAGLSVGEDGASAMTLEDLALMCSLPGMTVLVPADANETKAAVSAAVAWEGPVYLRMGRSSVPLLAEPGDEWKIGQARTMRPGKQITLVACGAMVALALEAADVLSHKGFSAEVLNYHTIKPFDQETLLDSAKRTGRVVVAEEHSIFGGLGSICARVLGAYHPVPMRFIATQDTFAESGKPEELMNKYGLTSDRILTAALELLHLKGIRE